MGTDNDTRGIDLHHLRLRASQKPVAGEVNSNMATRSDILARDIMLPNTQRFTKIHDWMYSVLMSWKYRYNPEDCDTIN